MGYTFTDSPVLSKSAGYIVGSPVYTPPDVPANTDVAPKSVTVLAASAVAVVLENTEDETVLATITVPAGSMGKDGILRVSYRASNTNSSDDKIVRVRFGGLDGTVMASSLNTTTVSMEDTILISNRGAEDEQIGGLVEGAFATATVDTSKDVSLVITGQLEEDETDTLTLESYLVELLRP